MNAKLCSQTVIAVETLEEKTSMPMVERVKTKPGTAFDGTDRQEDVVIAINGSCSCGAPANAQHCHLLFVKKETIKE